jgi:tol-pal system protein YbgF
VVSLALSRRLRQSAALALVIAIGAAGAAPAFAAGRDLPPAVPPAAPVFGAVAPPADIGDGRIHVAQSREEAQLIVRLQDLEGQVRTLTGQIEGLQFQLTQMQQLIDRMTQDNEYRFQQLEGGPANPPPPKPATSGDLGAPAPTGPGQFQTPATASAIPPAIAPEDQTASIQKLPPLASGDQPAAAMDGDEIPMDAVGQPLDLSLGDSQDPLLKGGTGTLGTLDQASVGPQSDPGAGLSTGDAKAQYAAGYDAMTRGDYDFAEDQFSQFIALFPADPQAPDATNWLGEAMIQRGAYTDAAQVLADGYTKYKDSKRAPDILLKLGIALSGADQRDVACRTFFTLAKRYPNLAPAFQTRLEEENQKAQCPPIG